MQTQKEFILIIIAAAFLLFILLAFILSMLLFHNRKQAAFQHEMALIKTNYEKELLKTQLEIQEETFQHISRELHDHVGHYLSLAKLQLTTLQSPLSARDTETVHASMAHIGHSLEEIRDIAKSLNTENIISNGLIKTAAQQVAALKKLGRFEVDFIVTGKTCFMDDQREIVLFRILQEAVTNILRHSQATAIRIALHYRAERLELVIHDNGIGFNTAQLEALSSNGSSGLKNIINRTALIHAIHQIRSDPGKGTTITIIAPYKPAI